MLRLSQFSLVTGFFEETSGMCHTFSGPKYQTDNCKKEFFDRGFNEPVVQAYFQYMIDVAVRLGAQENKSKEELQKVLDFEMKLANISLSREDQRKKTKLYNPTTLAKLPSGGGLPHSWTIYFQKLFEFGNKKLDIQETERVIIQDINFYKNLGSVLESTDNRTLANYIGWRIAHEAIDYLSSEGRDITQKFKKVLIGVDQKPPLWSTCLDKLTISGYKHVVDSMYARFIFNADSKEQVLDMTKYLRRSFSKILDDAEWMDEETKNKARKKLDNMKEHMAYPNELLNRAKVDGAYSELHPDEEDYFGNVLKLSKHVTQYSNLKLREVVNPHHWREWIRIALVGGFNIFSANTIEFEAGILQGTALVPLLFCLDYKPLFITKCKLPSLIKKHCYLSLIFEPERLSTI